MTKRKLPTIKHDTDIDLYTDESRQTRKTGGGSLIDIIEKHIERLGSLDYRFEVKIKNIDTEPDISYTIEPEHGKNITGKIEETDLKEIHMLRNIKTKIEELASSLNIGLDIGDIEVREPLKAYIYRGIRGRGHVLILFIFDRDEIVITFKGSPYRIKPALKELDILLDEVEQLSKQNFRNLEPYTDKEEDRGPWKTLAQLIYRPSQTVIRHSVNTEGEHHLTIYRAVEDSDTMTWTAISYMARPTRTYVGPSS